MNKKDQITPVEISDKEVKRRILPVEFYDRDTVEVARDSPGKILLKKNDGIWTGGMIVEAEAYLGEGDPACHAARGMTPGNRVMFGPVGHSYVYFIYGMYYCFNLVAFDSDTQKAGGVLIRALEPRYDISGMGLRRNRERIIELTNGPGKLCQAVDINRAHNGLSLREGNIVLIDNDYNTSGRIVRGTRIGIKKGADRSFRFYLERNRYVSRKSGLQPVDVNCNPTGH